jgi:acyl-CoA thioesterase-2
VPRRPAELLDLIKLDQLDDYTFQGAHVTSKRDRIYGGQVIAQGIIAAGSTIDPRFLPSAVHTAFLRQGDNLHPVGYHVTDLHTGRSFARRLVLAIQQGRTLASITVTFHVGEPGFEHELPPPAMPDRSTLPELADLLMARGDWQGTSQEFLSEWGALEAYYDSADGPDSPPAKGPAAVTIVCRIAIPQASPLQRAACFSWASDKAFLSTALIPHGLFSPNDVFCASLDHSIWFHRLVAPDDWWSFHLTSPTASHGRGLVQGMAFSHEGRHMATVMQEGLMRRSTEQAEHPGGGDHGR